MDGRGKKKGPALLAGPLFILVPKGRLGWTRYSDSMFSVTARNCKLKIQSEFERGHESGHASGHKECAGFSRKRQAPCRACTGRDPACSTPFRSLAVGVETVGGQNLLDFLGVFA